MNLFWEQSTRRWGFSEIGFPFFGAIPLHILKGHVNSSVLLEVSRRHYLDRFCVTPPLGLNIKLNYVGYSKGSPPLSRWLSAYTAFQFGAIYSH